MHRVQKLTLLPPLIPCMDDSLWKPDDQCLWTAPLRLNAHIVWLQVIETEQPQVTENEESSIYSPAFPREKWQRKRTQVKIRVCSSLCQNGWLPYLYLAHAYWQLTWAWAVWFGEWVYLLILFLPYWIRVASLIHYQLSCPIIYPAQVRIFWIFQKANIVTVTLKANWKLVDMLCS